MIPYLKIFIKRFFSSKRRKQLRRQKRHLVAFLDHKKKISIEEMKRLLTEELGLSKGDKMIISSSFGNLNADFSPQELIELLMDIVTEDGLIVMPYYPPINSTEWAIKNEVFDMRNTKSGMGILSNIFSKMPNVEMSKHPTKAVCAWGCGAHAIVDGHDKATTPFFWDSPYGKLLKNHSKSVGLGVLNIATMHAIEDILSEPHERYYQKREYFLDIIDKSGNKETVGTLVHDDTIMSRCVLPGDFVYKLNCRTYKRLKTGYNYSYVIENDDLFKTCEEQFKNGHSRER